MGRKRTPNAILALTGSRKFRPNEPELPPGIGEPPDFLTGRALQVWDETAEVLENAGILSCVESHVLAQYCVAVAECESATKILERDGLISQGEKGLVKHPAIVIRNNAAMRMLKFASEFGLTPASRGRVKGKRASKSNRFAEFNSHFGTETAQ